MINFLDFIILGKVNSFSDTTTISEVEGKYGEPYIFTPQRKSRPAMMVYGLVEFSFFENILTSVRIKLQEEYSIDIDDNRKIFNLPLLEDLSKECIETYLRRNSINWKIDSIMSNEDQLNFVTEYNVHLIFDLETKGAPLVQMNKVYSSSVLGDYYSKMK